MDIDYETATAQVERINAEAVRLRQQDLRARHIADAAVREAMHKGRRTDRDVADIATHAVMLALAMVYDQDGDLKVARAERDHFRKLAEDVMALSPSPLFIAAQGIPTREGGDA